MITEASRDFRSNQQSRLAWDPTNGTAEYGRGYKSFEIKARNREQKERQWGHKQPLGTLASVNLKQKCTLKRLLRDAKRPFSKRWQEKSVKQGQGERKQARRKVVSRIQMGKSPVATTDVFSLRSGRKRGDSRRQAVRRKGRDCRRAGVAMQPSVTRDNYQIWRHSGLCSGAWGQDGSGTKWPRTLIEL